MRLYAPTDCGPDGYPPEWHTTIKHEVREAAGHRCVRCLHPYRNGEHGNGEWSPCDALCRHAGPFRSRKPTGRDRPWVPSAERADLHAGHSVASGWDVEARWRILTVHHLNGVKFDCRWWNLVALCQRCHLHIQGKVQMARVWPWEHSDWFQPYVAGFYAWSYLGEDLSRGEVMARLNELLALERVA